MTDPLATDSGPIPVILVVAGCTDERELEADRTQEMVNLLDTAGRKVVATATQHLPKIAAGTYIGSGKMEEVKALMVEHGAMECAFDVSLSPRQQRNLEEHFGATVLDYDEIILSIFAQNARTHQARLAVQLAQAKYMRGRLRRMWTHLDRQRAGGSGGGGSGFLTGTGEKQIEMDRRQVRQRIQDLQEDLDHIADRTERKVQARDTAFNIALVGYTNAGKSTLMNALTGAGVLAENRLFATLDTRTARVRIGDHRNVVLSDTVGFIRNLPHSLIASFHATLAEVREADLLLHVVDSASPVMEEQIAAVTKVLGTIEADGVPMITVFNKLDACPSRTVLAAVRRRHKGAVAVSARTGEGLDSLREAIAARVESVGAAAEVRYPVTDGATDAWIRARMSVKSERLDDETMVLSVVADAALLGELEGRAQVRREGTRKRSSPT